MTRVPCSAVLLAVAIGATALGYPGEARTADSDSVLLHDRFTVSLGTFLLDTKTKISVDGSASSGTVVDLDRDLGFRDTNRVRLDATWRFLPRHKARIMYFDTSSSSTRTIDRDLTIGDTVFPVNGELNSKYSTNIAELAYEYVFLKRESYEVTGTFGLHMVKFDFAVSGDGSVNGQPTEFRSESASTTAPLPVFGVRSLWEFHPQWYLDGQFQYFSLKFDGYDGRITDARVGVTRMFGEHFGVGAGFNSFTTTLGANKDKFDGELKWRYSGAQLFITGSF